ncbi:Serine protease [Ceratobasidium sp. AG-Ba]|nr:Serine protease [Ceratobasidium sp. AG-Ba]QRW06454.1 Serine protease [Ceratobasidium sp. AG-Ba]
MRGFISRFVAALAAFTALGDVVFAAPATSNSGQSGSARYIVMLKDGASLKTHKTWVDGQRAKLSKSNAKSQLQVTNDYDVLNGYSANLTADALADLSSNPDVAMVVPDVPCSGDLTQTDAPWGIARVSRKTRLPIGSSVNNVNYVFNRKPSGSGVDVYVIDTGVNTAHVDFGGRARWGATFGGYQNRDGHGHGTHIAGTIAGKRYGVAKAASIIAVKVLNDDNKGSMSDVIAGVNWATRQALASGRPSVLSISIGSDEPHLPTDQAVNNAVKLGMHVVVSAGNKNVDCKNQSPARAQDVITVGATNINDARWVWSATSGSNFGPGVDIFAPGEYITSTWIGSTTATNRITGTSMATPHVSGLIAYLLAVEGRRTPANMRLRLKQLAPDGILTGIPAGTGNEIIWNGGA